MATMIKVHFLGKKNICYYRHFFPVLVFKKELSDYGIIVDFFSNPSSRGIEDCDILIFLEQNYRDILPIVSGNRQYALDFLACFLPKFKKVIWFDDHDSSGMLRTYIFPFVDAYYKSQVVKNPAYYQEQHKTGVPHRDYVIENHQVHDESILKGMVSDQDITKIDIAWNLGFVNWSFLLSWSRLRRQINFHITRNYSIRYTEPNLATRMNHVTFHGQKWKNDPSVFWWRKNTIEELQSLNLKHPELRIISSGKVSKKDYHLEMRNTIISSSPFGYGEICYRDFESFINGSLLFKPNMDHLITWPNLYIDGVTFISHRWDFSDFEEKIDNILTNPARYEDIAREGQNRFRQVLTDGQAFALHFHEILSRV